MDAANCKDVYPAPVFEGSEKRIEVDFDFGHATPAGGLRALTRAQLDELMTLAACTIVSTKSTAEFDSYVLSESSLFVYPTKYILKTCGTTKLLCSVPRLIEMAAEMCMKPSRSKFTRASYLFPEQQHFPHTSFDDETVFMQDIFSKLGLAGERYVLGDDVNGLQWHVYLASNPNKPYHEKSVTHAFEVCMTELDETKARQFFRTKDFVSAEQTTKDTGIRALVPKAAIDDYVFDPCGYSMNGVEDGGYMTIHITPENGFSYASVELCGFESAKYDPAAMLHQITQIFKPGKMSVSVSVDETSTESFSWGSVLEAPAGYSCESGTCQEFMAGGRVVFYNLSANNKSAFDDEPGSPTTVLHQLSSVSMSDSDEGMEGACSD